MLIFPCWPLVGATAAPPLPQTRAVLCSLTLQQFYLDFFMFLPLVPATKVVDFAYYSYFGLTWI